MAPGQDFADQFLQRIADPNLHKRIEAIRRHLLDRLLPENRMVYLTDQPITWLVMVNLRIAVGINRVSGRLHCKGWQDGGKLFGCR